MNTAPNSPPLMIDEVEAWLAAFVRAHDGVAGSVHHVRDGALHITAAHALPEPVVRATAVVPRGKGMAGLAWELDEPVQTCNLQNDESGAVKPGAKAVGAQGAVAFPVHDANGVVRAVVGIAWADERVLGEAELGELRKQSTSLP